jgi:hypothetical protein
MCFFLPTTMCLRNMNVLIFLRLWFTTYTYGLHTDTQTDTDTAERRPMSAVCGGRESGAIGYALQRSRAGLRGWGRPLLC